MQPAWALRLCCLAKLCMQAVPSPLGNSGDANWFWSVPTTLDPFRTIAYTNCLGEGHLQGKGRALNTQIIFLMSHSSRLLQCNMAENILSLALHLTKQRHCCKWWCMRVIVTYLHCPFKESCAATECEQCCDWHCRLVCKRRQLLCNRASSSQVLHSIPHQFSLQLQSRSFCFWLVSQCYSIMPAHQHHKGSPMTIPTFYQMWWLRAPLPKQLSGPFSAASLLVEAAQTLCIHFKAAMFAGRLCIKMP